MMAPPKCAHGTYRRYAKHGCRCVECTAANAQHHRSYTQRHPEAIRRGNLQQKGMTVEDYDALFEAQGGVCAACGLPETGRNQFGTLRLAVDHDHVTGQRRGLLCMRCNRSLGMMGDNVAVIQAILNYRKEYT